MREEKETHEDVMSLWNEEFTEEEVKEMIKEKRSFRKLFKSKGLVGSEKFILELFRRVYPETVNINMVKPIPIGRQTDAKILKLFSPKKDDNAKNDKGNGVDNDQRNASGKGGVDKG